MSCNDLELSLGFFVLRDTGMSVAVLQAAVIVAWKVVKVDTEEGSKRMR